MKIIIETKTNCVKYAYSDSDTVVIGSFMTCIVDEFGKPVTIIKDMKKDTAHLIESDLPDGETLETFIGDKYLYDDKWSLNPDYVYPVIEEEK